MTRETIDLPVIVAGTIIDGRDRRSITLDYESGLSIRIPEFTDEDFDLVRDTAHQVQRDLSALSIRDVSEFLAQASVQWLAEDSEWRNFAMRYAPQVTGFHERMHLSDYYFFGEFMELPANLYDQVASELGHEHIFDEWIPVQASYVRAFGIGLATHILVGNLPLASLYSLIRGVISRNVNLAKMPVRDPISPHAFVRNLIEVDPDHPISRALSLAYWERTAPVGNRALKESDVLLVWGGQQTVENISSNAGGTPVVQFGPRRSLAVLDLDRELDLERAATRLAFTTGYYDQEACFSPQIVLVRGDVKAFEPYLVAAFEKFSSLIPLVTRNRDVLAHRSSTMLTCEYLDWDVVEAGDGRIVYMPPGAEPVDHPLTRTLFVHEIESLDEVSRFLGHDVQTVCVYPWDIALEYRDAWAVDGADRIVEMGMSGHPRQGFSHDGMRWLNQVTRVVSVERPTSQLYRYNSLNSEQLEHWLFEGSMTGEL